MAGHNADTLFEYGLIDQNRRLLAGTLDNFKLSEGWQLIMRTPDSKQPEKNNPYLIYIETFARWTFISPTIDQR